MQDRSSLTFEGLEEIYEPYFQDHGWIHYHHKDQIAFKAKGFPDSPHHTFFLVCGFHLLGRINEVWFERIKKGYESLLYTDGSVGRDPKVTDPEDKTELEKCNRDQYMAMIIGLICYGILPNATIQHCLDSHFFWPHHRVWIFRSIGARVVWPLRVFCDLFEIMDTLCDIFTYPFMSQNGSDSSMIKSYLRTAFSLKLQPTFLMRLNWRLLLWFKNPRGVFRTYFTHKINGVNSTDQPPPIHLIWEKVWDQLDVPHLD